MQTDISPWLVENSEYLHKEPWLTVRRDSVRLRNGHLIPNYYVIEYPEWVNCIAITDEGKFVLVRQYRHALGSTHFELCAGVTEPGDPSLLISAQRELEEETGYGGGEWAHFCTLSQNPATNNNLTHTFLAKGVTRISDPNLDAGEELTVHLFSREEVKDLLLTGGIIQALQAAPLWRYLAMNNA
jgi:ADP-ribose pyrophosphatase